eukprot:5307056-Pleurochrysis_carterae.AAC.2
MTNVKCEVNTYDSSFKRDLISEVTSARGAPFSPQRRGSLLFARQRSTRTNSSTQPRQARAAPLPHRFSCLWTSSHKWPAS